MSGKLSKHLLFKIRNAIDVNILIRDILEMPTKHREGFLRFLCPICSDFNTATNPKTNLARCFRCNENFNAIDLVMVVKNADFKQSVNFLIPFLEQRSL